MALNDGFYTIRQYVECKQSIYDQILAIDALIILHRGKMLDSIGNSDIDEYQMDDGQMKVRTKYRSVKDVMAGIDALKIWKQELVNDYNGRTTVLRSGNF